MLKCTGTLCITEGERVRARERKRDTEGRRVEAREREREREVRQ